MAALEIYQLDPTIRKNLALILVTLVAERPPGKVQIGPKAADRAHAISSTAAKHSPAVLMIRANYLLKSGRWEESDEINEVLKELRHHGTLHSGTWLVEAMHAAKVGDPARAARAAEKGLRLPNAHPDHRIRFNRLLEAFRKMRHE